MEMEVDEVTNILQLPDKVLHLIFQHIPKNTTKEYLKYNNVVGEVCKRFYKIICDLRTVKLDLTDSKLDNGIMDSVLNSVRKIEALEYSSYSDALNEILKRIGESIKEVKIEGMYSDQTEKFTFKTIELLNLMPNLIRVDVSDIYDEEQEEQVPENFRLQLHHLKELQITSCETDCVVEAFQTLPDDVLEKLSIFGCFFFNAPFNNQRNLKHVDIDRKAMECLDLKNAKLKTLTGHFYGIQDLKGQDELVSLESLTPRDQVDVNFICKELKSLEYLELVFLDHDYDFEPVKPVKLNAIAKLKNLKTLKLQSTSCSLKTLKNESLEHLIYRGDFPANPKVVSNKCPNLRHLEVLRTQLDISSIFRSFPKLEDFNWQAQEITYNGKFGSKSLKVLGVHVGYENEKKAASADTLVAIARACPNLEVLSTNIEFGDEWLQNLLIGNPSLKSLCLCFTPNIQIIKNFGGNLENVHITTGEFSDFIIAASRELADHFDVFGKKSSGDVMKKRGYSGKCCSGMIYFEDFF